MKRYPKLSIFLFALLIAIVWHYRFMFKFEKIEPLKVGDTQAIKKLDEYQTTDTPTDWAYLYSLNVDYNPYQHFYFRGEKKVQISEAYTECGNDSTHMVVAERPNFHPVNTPLYFIYPMYYKNMLYPVYNVFVVIDLKRFEKVEEHYIRGGLYSCFIDKDYIYLKYNLDGKGTYYGRIARYHKGK